MADIAMMAKGGNSPWMEAPKSRAIRRNSSYDDEGETESDPDNNDQNRSLEAGLHFFDSFQETPKAADDTGQMSFDEAAGVNQSEAALNDAVSGALVGENVLDSPSSSRNTKSPNSAKETAPSCTSTASLPEPVSLSVGLVSQGLSWIRSQREERRRRYLQHQAEVQALKIREAQLAAANSADSSGTTSTGLVGNSTFKNLASILMSGGAGNRNSVEESSPSPDITTEEEDGDKPTGNTSDELIKTGVSCTGDGYMVEFSVPAEEEESDWVPPVRIESEENLSSVPHILTVEHRQQVAQYVLPSGIVYAKWKRLYSLARDGDSFDACLRLVAGHDKTLLVVRTSLNEVLGGFADMAWDHPTIGGHQYFGGSTSCIFSFSNKRNDKQGKDGRNKVNVYKWTGKNRYIQLCDAQHKMLAFGGGGEDGAFGLSVAHDFQHGSSGPCDTFDNDPLSDISTNFRIVDLEIYCFLLGQF